MSEELKPCPFCGAGARKEFANGDERDGYANRMTFSCSGCGARVTAVGDMSKGGYADNSTVEARAIAAWNRRTPPASESALAEAVLAWWDEQSGDAPAFVELAMKAQAVPFDGEVE